MLSQTDREFDTTQYIKQYPDLAKDVDADIKYAWKLKGDIAELERERISAEKTHRKNTKRLKELSAEIKKLTSRLGALSSASSPSGALLSMRKRGADDIDLDEGKLMYGIFFFGNILIFYTASSTASLEQIELRRKLVELQQQLSDLKHTVQSGAKDLISFGRRMASKKTTWFYARSRCMVQCIRHRNELSSASIRNDYRATLQEMGRQPNKDLQVFPVSATVHLYYQNSEKRHLGFPNREDTQISAFREWLLGTTLDDRERYAQAFLDDVDAFLASIQPWIMDKFGDSKMSAELRARWEPQMESLVADLEAVRHLV